MNIVIIEDEPLTAEDLADIVGAQGHDFHISAILDSVKSAISFFKHAPPVDLVFSDIQLGDGLSFEIFRTTPIQAPIIFCTAYDEYALEAIRTNGIEYILKPFTEQSIARAIAKYHQLKNHFSAPIIDFEKLIRAMVPRQNDPKPAALLVYHRDKLLPMAWDEVALFYIENELTHLHCFNAKSYVVPQTLEELDELAKGKFFRVNRQYLVNRRAIQDANHYQHRKYVLNLTIAFKEALVVSKNRTNGFLTWLTQER